MQKSVVYYIKSNYSETDSNKIIVLTGRFSGYLKKAYLKYGSIHVWICPHSYARIALENNLVKWNADIGDFLELDFDMGKSEATWHCGINIFKSTVCDKEKSLSREEKEALKKKGSISSFGFSLRCTQIERERHRMGY